MKKRRYVVTDIHPNSPCPVQPEPLGLGMWRYPWRYMEPGNWFILLDPSDEARAKLSSAAAAAGRRLGMRLSTGPWFENEWDRRHSGWWCIRHDGCVVHGPSYASKTERRAADAAEARERRRIMGMRGDKRPRKMKLIEPLGTYAPAVAPPLEEGDYTGWDKPVPPEEYL